MYRRFTIKPEAFSLSAALALIFFLVSVVRWPLPAHTMRIGFRLAFEIGISAGLVFYVARYVNGWVGAFLGLATFSQYYPLYGPASWNTYLAVLFGVIWYAVLVQGIGKRCTTHFLNAMAVAALMNVAFQICEWSGIPFMYQPIQTYSGGYPGLMSNPNEAAAFLALAFPVFLRRGWRWGLAPLGLGLVLARTAAGPLAVAVGLMAFGVLKGRLKVTLAASLILFAGYLALVDQPGLERWAIWRRGLELWWQRPLLGAGLGHWSIVIEKLGRLDSGFWSMAHNEFLQGLFEMGAGFLVIAAGYLVQAARRCRKIAAEPSETAILAAAALSSLAALTLVSYLWHIAVLAMTALTWMAVFEIETQGERR